jgi:DNA ligase (NAD+)
MTPAEASPRISALRTTLAHHDELYYRRAKPEITDFDYDLLKAELAALEQRFPEEPWTVGGYGRVSHRGLPAGK